MGAMKDYLIQIQELVVEAMLNGATSDSDVYAYVYMFEPNVTEQTVKEVTKQIFLDGRA